MSEFFFAIFYGLFQFFSLNFVIWHSSKQRIWDRSDCFDYFHNRTIHELCLLLFVWMVLVSAQDITLLKCLQFLHRSIAISDFIEYFFSITITMITPNIYVCIVAALNWNRSPILFWVSSLWVFFSFCFCQLKQVKNVTAHCWFGFRHF